MNRKLFIAAFFLLIGSEIFSQTDTLNVYLEKNLEHRLGVDLVFENNSNDTIVLFTRFHNFTHEGLIPQTPGIAINFFSNNRPFLFNPGDMPSSPFIFPRGFTFILPQSKVKLFFDIGEERYFPEKSLNKYEVSFFMNYHFSKFRSPEPPESIIYFETNRVTIVEASEEKDE